MSLFQSSIIATTAKARFRGFGITLPSAVAASRGVMVHSQPIGRGAPSSPKQAMGSGPSFGGIGKMAPAGTASAVGGASGLLVAGGAARLGAQGLAGIGSAAPQTILNPLFLPASSDPLDLERQRQMHAELDAFIDRLSRAVAEAVTYWQRVFAGIAGITVNGSIAFGGRMLGGSLDSSLIRQYTRLDGEPEYERARYEAVADGLRNAWGNWMTTVTVPGLRWYPSFENTVGPFAPPTANQPCLLSAMQGASGLVKRDQLKAQMMAKLSGGGDHGAQVLDAMAAGIESAFVTWLSTTRVQNVMASGPVPTMGGAGVAGGFRGRVVGGSAVGLPGFLS